MPLPPALQNLLDQGLLVDPLTLAPLRLSDAGDTLLAPDGRSYPIVGGVPALLRTASTPPPSPTEPDRA